jgi:hypothetical protein
MNSHTEPSSGRSGQPSAALPTSASARAFTETLHAEIHFPPTWILDTLAVSPDGRRVAYAQTRGTKQSVTVDGIPGN